MSTFDDLRDALRSHRPTVLVTRLDGEPGVVGAKLLAVVDRGRAPVVTGTLGDPDLDRVALRDALGELDAGRSGVRHYGPHGENGQQDVAVFIESFAPPPTMVVVGAVDFTAALVRVAKVLGYRLVVADARPAFATARRFPLADEIAVDWPHRVIERVGPSLGPADAVCVLTHDHKFDVPAIVAALATDVGYIGAMGSRRTTAERADRLREAGVTDAQLGRVHAPIGLDLGARTPEETAVSICAEIIAARSGRSAVPLRDVDGPLHDSGALR